MVRVEGRLFHREVSRLVEYSRNFLRVSNAFRYHEEGRSVFFHEKNFFCLVGPISRSMTSYSLSSNARFFASLIYYFRIASVLEYRSRGSYLADLRELLFPNGNFGGLRVDLPLSHVVGLRSINVCYGRQGVYFLLTRPPRYLVVHSSRDQCQYSSGNYGTYLRLFYHVRGLNGRTIVPSRSNVRVPGSYARCHAFLFGPS